MKKKSLFLAAAVCVCLLAALFIGGSRSHGDGTAADEPGLLAEYHGEKVYQADVEAYSDTARLLAGADAELPTEREILTEFLQNMVLLEEAQAPRTIARQKLLDAVGEKFCEENGLTFTKVNPPPKLMQAKKDYVADLFAQAQDETIYYNGAG